MALERRGLGLLGLGAVLAPKCPACLAGYLASAGLGLGAATAIAPLLRPVGISIAAFSAASIAWRYLRRRRGPGCHGGAEGTNWLVDVHSRPH